jgi:hypothetical protein
MYFIYLSPHLALKIERFVNTVQVNVLYGSRAHRTALINSLVSITREESVCCAVQTESLIIIHRDLYKKCHVMTTMNVSRQVFSAYVQKRIFHF